MRSLLSRTSLLAAALLLPAGCGPAGASPAQEKGDGAPRPLSEVVKGATRTDGLLTLYQTRDKLYLAVPESLLGTDLGFSSRRPTGMGDGGLRGSDLENAVVAWRREGDRLLLLKRNLLFRTEGDPALAPAVRDAFADSPVLSAPLVRLSDAPGPLLIDAKDLLGQGLAELFPAASGYASNPEETSVLSVRGAGDFLSVRLSFRFARKDDAAKPPTRLADPRFFRATAEHTFFRLPPEGYRPREADERIACFESAFKDYAGMSARRSPFRRVLLRWDLRKTDPKADVSPCANPVTFYIDRAVPKEIVPLVREGTLWWNKAFEAAGIRDAIRAEEMPEDPAWVPPLRHGTIYWCLNDELRFSGLAGPSLADPRTGEVLQANVWLNGEFFEYARNRYQVYAWWRQPSGTDPFTEASPRTAAARAPLPHGCDYAPSLSSQMAFARLVFMSRGTFGPGDPGLDAYVRQSFLLLVAHEVGHALGFHHNWKASRIRPAADVAAGRCSGRDDGSIFSASVMDYNPIYIAPKGVAQKDYYLREVGPYDKLAVDFLYRPFDGRTPAEEAKALAAIAERAETSPGLAADSGTLIAADPSVATDDLGDDGIAFAASRLAMLHEELLPRLPELVIAEGHDYSAIGKALDVAVFSIAMDYADLLARHVGGRTILKRSPAAASAGQGPPPVRPVGAADQRRALDLLERLVLREGLFSLPPAVRERLKPELAHDWNFPWRFAAGYAAEQRVAWLYASTVGTLLDAGRLARVLDNEKLAAPDADRITLPELFGRIEGAAFGSLKPPPAGAVPSDARPLLADDRRALQRVVVRQLTGLVLAPPSAAPAEASQIAAQTLRSIRSRIEPLLAPQTAARLDGYTKAHLADLDARIQRALEATIVTPADR